MSANRCPNQNCEYFNRVLPNSAKVCPMCGTPVGNAIPAAPTNPGASSPPVEPQQPPQQPIVQQPNYQTPPRDYTVEQPQAPYVQPVPSYTPPPQQRFPQFKLIHSSGKEYRLRGEAGYIGRCTQTMTLPPEIDLTGIANEGIVSRRHARIYWDWSQNIYMIVDMSTNGIYLNNTQLTPGVQYRLLNGDSMQLGQGNLLNFRVEIM